jgi:hypothetical protein
VEVLDEGKAIEEIKEEDAKYEGGEDEESKSDLEDSNPNELKN